ncbi:MAG: hypothetical protein CEO19_136 [Parcubacteria group bacterium Gr01-1014_73]|nr:MAG: hypothetical protein CEO19_136 [Parcubacteria group bacterium Gr01-1014_73]
MNYVLKNKNDGVRKWPLWLSALLLISFTGTYIFYTQGLVVNTVKNRQARAKIDKIMLKIGELETEYVNLQNEITMEKAYELGFLDTNSEFIAGAAFGKSVSIRNEIQ